MKKKVKLHAKLLNGYVADGYANLTSKAVNLLTNVNDNVTDANSTPMNYTYCAGDHCVTCTKEWDKNQGAYYIVCKHYTKGVFTGAEAHLA